MIEMLFAVDQQVLEWLYAYRAVPVSQAFIVISEFGSVTAIYGIMAALGLWLVMRDRLADAFGLAIAVCGSGALILALKGLVSRARPDMFYQAYAEGPYWSFPSAHAGLCFALYGYIAFVILDTFPGRYRVPAILALSILAVLVSFSRLYLGVHYASDVAIGALIGAFFAWLGSRARIHVLPRA